jgi:hypothetical protein
MPKRPSWVSASTAFRAVYDDIGKSVSAVGTKLGGKVDYNINSLTPEQGQFQNACAIRMSHVLNETGTAIPTLSGKTVSGDGGRHYFFRLQDLVAFLKSRLGPPDLVFTPPTRQKLAGRRGILIFEVNGWVDASGHATLWSGNSCADQCFFDHATKAYLWMLED